MRSLIKTTEGTENTENTEDIPCPVILSGALAERRISKYMIDLIQPQRAQRRREGRKEFWMSKYKKINRSERNVRNEKYYRTF